MRREAVGDPGEPMDQKAGECGVISEVAMDVIDVGGRHEPGGVDDLGEDRETADEEVGAPHSAS